MHELHGARLNVYDVFSTPCTINRITRARLNHCKLYSTYVIYTIGDKFQKCRCGPYTKRYMDIASLLYVKRFPNFTARMASDCIALFFICPKNFKNFQRPGLAQICHCHSRRVPICGSPCKQRFQLSGSVNACRDSPGAGGWNKSMNPWTPNVQSAVCKVCSCGLLLSCKKHRSKQLYSDSQFTLNSIDKQWHA